MRRLLILMTALWACSSEPPPPAPVRLVTDFERPVVEAALATLNGGAPPLKLEVLYAAEPGAGTDVFWSQRPAPALALAKAGRTLAHVPAKPPAIRDAGGSWNGAAGVGWVLLLNKSRLPPGYVPDSMEDLTNPRFRGFFSLVPPESPLVRDFRAALTEVWGADQARVLVDLMVRNEARIVPTMADAADAVVAGRALLTMADSVSAEHFTRDNPQLEVVLPDQDNLGMLLVPSVVVVMNDAPHPEAARALVDRLVALGLPGRVVPRPDLKVMAADVTRFEPPTPVSAAPEPASAAAEPASAASAPASAPGSGSP